MKETLQIAKISNAPVIVSGGVSSIKDLEEIKKNTKNNIEGAIVGKAIYDGDILLEELSEFINA